jgi:hypothetical protein
MFVSVIPLSLFILYHEHLTAFGKGDALTVIRSLSFLFFIPFRVLGWQYSILVLINGWIVHVGLRHFIDSLCLAVPLSMCIADVGLSIFFHFTYPTTYCIIPYSSLYAMTASTPNVEL